MWNIDGIAKLPRLARSVAVAAFILVAPVLGPHVIMGNNCDALYSSQMQNCAGLTGSSYRSCASHAMAVYTQCLSGAHH
jgi:hypothetical protein